MKICMISSIIIYIGFRFAAFTISNSNRYMFHISIKFFSLPLTFSNSDFTSSDLSFNVSNTIFSECWHKCSTRRINSKNLGARSGSLEKRFQANRWNTTGSKDARNSDTDNISHSKIRVDGFGFSQLQIRPLRQKNQQGFVLGHEYFCV